MRDERADEEGGDERERSDIDGSQRADDEDEHESHDSDDVDGHPGPLDLSMGSGSAATGSRATAPATFLVCGSTFFCCPDRVKPSSLAVLIDPTTDHRRACTAREADAERPVVPLRRRGGDAVA